MNAALNGEMPSLEAIKQSFIEQRGYWRPWAETTLHINPGFVQQYASFAGYPARTGPLSARMVELIYVALDASSSHLFESGLLTHMKRAIEVGATQAEIFDVLHLVSVQGIVSVCEAAQILAEVTAVDLEIMPSELEHLRARIERLGSDHALALTTIARLDPGYVEVLLSFLELGKPGDGLTVSERSLVQLALHACFTAFNPNAIRQIIASASEQGVTRTELLQAIQLGSHLAVHGTALGATVYQRAVQELTDPTPSVSTRGAHPPTRSSD